MPGPTMDNDDVAMVKRIMAMLSKKLEGPAVTEPDEFDLALEEPVDEMKAAPTHDAEDSNMISRIMRSRAEKDIPRPE